MIWRFEMIDEDGDTNTYTQYGGEFGLLKDDPERIVSWFKPLMEGDDYVCPGCTDIVVYPHVCPEDPYEGYEPDGQDDPEWLLEVMADIAFAEKQELDRQYREMEFLAGLSQQEVNGCDVDDDLPF